MSEEPIRVVHITDCHLSGRDEDRVGGIDTQATLIGVLDHIAGQGSPPDLIFATGDLSHDGSPESYTRFGRALERIGAPVYCLGGNHDVGAAMLAILVRHGLHVERVLALDAWFIHLLPTALAGREDGAIQPAELEALDATLRANRDKHALICLHHHPVPVGGPWGAKVGIENPDELFHLIDGHANVRCLLWGHVHKSFESRHQAVRLLATPSTSFDVLPGGDGSPAIGPAKPGYRRLALHADGTIESEVCWIS